MSYPNLEPNHEVRPGPLGYEVWCPFEIINGHVALHSYPVSQTSIWAQEAEPEEMECPVCVTLNGEVQYIGSTDCEDNE